MKWIATVARVATTADMMRVIDQKPERIGAHGFRQRRLVHGDRDRLAAHRRFAEDGNEASWRRRQGRKCRREKAKTAGSRKS